jgi:hypothetical protein
MAKARSTIRFHPAPAPEALAPVVNHEDLFRRLLLERVELSGDIAEFGVYNGGSTRQLAGYGRRVWAFDTYEGVPSEDWSPVLDDQNPPGKFKPLISRQKMFDGYPNIIPVVGRFATTLPALEGMRIVFAYVDCDLYEAHRQCLEWLETRMVPGGAILFDDYERCAGAKKAIDEWVGALNLELKDGMAVEWPDRVPVDPEDAA